MELEYFCENHNKLCCAVCITKIKGNGKGQHAGCNICFITEIKDKKKSKLNENIEILENHGHIFADLTEPAEWNYLQFGVRSQ